MLIEEHGYKYTTYLPVIQRLSSWGQGYCKVRKLGLNWTKLPVL